MFSWPAAFLVALSAGSASDPWMIVRLGGFTHDGANISWSVEAVSPDETNLHSVVVHIVTDRDGSILKTCRDGGKPAADAPPEAVKRWAAAAPEVECERWSAAHPVISPVVAGQPFTHRLQVPGPRTELTLEMISDRARCPTHILVATLGSVSGAVAEDPCLPGEEKSAGANGMIEVGWSPDGDRAAVGWDVTRDPPGGCDSNGVDSLACNDEGWSARRAHLVVVSRRTLASIDLLDAGAGAGLDALAERLVKAGFRVGHRGAAKSARDQTEIYYARGFEREAKELTKLLGLPESAAQTLTWKTPYAITVAAGR